MREQGPSLRLRWGGSILLVVCCGVTSAYAGSWNTTGSLSQARRQFSAIRLSTGNVLVSCNRRR